MNVYVFNGPNLGRLGTRQVDVYGHTTYADLVELCVRVGKELREMMGLPEPSLGDAGQTVPLPTENPL